MAHLDSNFLTFALKIKEIEFSVDIFEYELKSSKSCSGLFFSSRKQELLKYFSIQAYDLPAR